jgi:ribosomal protein S18 acetylase RimI-like enzyme
LKISLKKIESEAEFEAIKNLYLTAFPPNERRELDELKKQIYNENCNVNLIFAGEKIAGFVILWNFTDFVFPEHFAIEPGLRGLGTGEKTLSEIISLYQKTVILETELPADEISRRRIGFYERNGFHLLERQYFQPSYDGIKPEVEMKLMCSSANISPEKLEKYIQQIREKVYHKIFNQND